MVIGAYLLISVNSIAASVGLGLVNVPDFFTLFAGEILLGAFALPAAYGLWTLKPWGWTLAVNLGVAVLVFAAGMGAYFLATYNDFTETEAMLLPMAISIGAVYYLNTPNAKIYFGK
jgi:hypothetical protein